MTVKILAQGRHFVELRAEIVIDVYMFEDEIIVEDPVLTQEVRDLTEEAAQQYFATFDEFVFFWLFDIILFLNALKFSIIKDVLRHVLKYFVGVGLS